MISIIVPVYNSENYIARCIESILSQTSYDWELILINDGSSDYSENICNYYAHSDKRIHVINQDNKGVSSARNTGLVNARGEWVTFCDSDDELNKMAIEIYENNINEDIDIIRGGFERDKNGHVSIITIPDIETDNKDNIISICSDSCYEAYLWNTCFRRSTIGSIRFDEKISWCEDHLFTYKVIREARRVRFISEIVYRYFAPSKVNNSFGLNLSTKYIEPDMIIDEAIQERDIKRSFLANNQSKGRNLVELEYRYKVDLALRYAVIGNKYAVAIKIALNNGMSSFIKLASIIFHTKITSGVRRIFKLIPNIIPSV